MLWIRLPVVLIGVALVLAACGTAAHRAATLRLYTSVTQDTVDAVLDALAEQRPDLTVEVFRAPTGELDARIAAERRAGGISADVLWGTDPLSTQRYAADGLLAPLGPAGFGAVPAQYRTAEFVGTRLLNLVIVVPADAPLKPQSWADLATLDLGAPVAIPDPGFAGSAFVALGYFATADGLGMDFYRRLKERGAVQVASIGDVITGVAERRFGAGITLDKSARDAIGSGAPIELIWPQPGAIVLYSPAAVFAASDDHVAARELIELLVSAPAQAAIAGTGWQPIRHDVAWDYSGPVVTVDWGPVFGSQRRLLDDYRAIFGD